MIIARLLVVRSSGWYLTSVLCTCVFSWCHQMAACGIPELTITVDDASVCPLVYDRYSETNSGLLAPPDQHRQTSGQRWV